MKFRTLVGLIVRAVQSHFTKAQTEINIRFTLEDNDSPRTDLQSIYFPKRWARCTIGKEYRDLVLATLCHETFHIAFDTLEKDKEIYKPLSEREPDKWPSFDLWNRCVEMLLNIHDDTRGFTGFRHLKEIYRYAYLYWIKQHWDFYDPSKQENFWPIFFLMCDVIGKGVFQPSDFPEYKEQVDLVERKDFKLLLALAKPKMQFTKPFKDEVMDKEKPLFAHGLKPIGMLSVVFARLLTDEVKKRNEEIHGITGESAEMVSVQTLKQLANIGTSFGIELLNNSLISENLVDRDGLRNALSKLMKQRTDIVPAEKFNIKNIAHVKTDMERLYEGEVREDFYEENWWIYYVIDRSGSMESAFNSNTNKTSNKREESHLDVVKGVLLQITEVMDELSGYYNLNHRSIGVAYDNVAEEFEVTKQGMTKIAPRGGTVPQAALRFVRNHLGAGRADCVIVIFLSDGQFYEGDAEAVMSEYKNIKADKKAFLPVLITDAGPSFKDPHFKYVAKSKFEIEQALFNAIVSGYSELM